MVSLLRLGIRLLCQVCRLFKCCVHSIFLRSLLLPCVMSWFTLIIIPKMLTKAFSSFSFSSFSLSSSFSFPSFFLLSSSLICVSFFFFSFFLLLYVFRSSYRLVFSYTHPIPYLTLFPLFFIIRLYFVVPIMYLKFKQYKTKINYTGYFQFTIFNQK